MWRWSSRDSGWQAGSVRVDGNLDSDSAGWIMSAMRGRQRIDLASGGMSSRAAAERVCVFLNDQSPDRWDYLLEHVIGDLLRGEWG